MRPVISTTILALALLAAAACTSRDTSAPASNSAAATRATQNPPAVNASAPTAPATQTVANNAATTTAQQPPALPAPAAMAGDDVARVKLDELQAEMKAGTVVVFDVRDKAAYDLGHIKGAKLVPVGEVEQRLSEFPKNKQIVTYCA